MRNAQDQAGASAQSSSGAELSGVERLRQQIDATASGFAQLRAQLQLPPDATQPARPLDPSMPADTGC